jgi:integrase
LTVKVERRGPLGDKRGRKAEDMLVEALTRLAGGGEVTSATKTSALIDRHLERVEEDGAAIRTVDTYRADAVFLKKAIGGVRAGEATADVCDRAVQKIKADHGAVTARRCRTILKAALHYAVMANVLPTNPVREVAAITSDTKVQGATALTVEKARKLLAAVRASEECRRKDLTDLIIVLIATGLRRSELLALRWRDYDRKARTITVTGKLVRAKGKGLIRVEDRAKTDAGLRTIPLPRFAAECLDARKKDRWHGSHPMIFASTSGTWRDPDNLAGQWRGVRDDLDAAGVSFHAFRKTVATLIDGAGLTARIGADHLGHSQVSMTQDVYFGRGGVHAAVADALDEALG